MRWFILSLRRSNIISSAVWHHRSRFSSCPWHESSLRRLHRLEILAFFNFHSFPNHFGALLLSLSSIYCCVSSASFFLALLDFIRRRNAQSPILELGSVIRHLFPAPSVVGNFHLCMADPFRPVAGNFPLTRFAGYFSFCARSKLSYKVFALSNIPCFPCGGCWFIPSGGGQLFPLQICCGSPAGLKFMHSF